MDVAALRTLLAGPIAGRSFKFAPQWYNAVRTRRTCSLGGLVRASETFFPLSVNEEADRTIAFDVTDIFSMVRDPGLGIYIPDKPHQATFWTVDARHDIVMSGVFSGCDFVIVYGRDGIAMAHVYRKSDDQVVPVESQISSVQQAIGGRPQFGSGSKSFRTSGQGGPGYVIATRVGHWKYHWLRVAGGRVSSAEEIAEGRWAAA